MKNIYFICYVCYEIINKLYKIINGFSWNNCFAYSDKTGVRLDVLFLKAGHSCRELHI